MSIYDGDESSIERFLLYRAYALRYGSGADSSIPAFEFLIIKFPNSENSHESLADTWAVIGNDKKAIESYQVVLSINPESENAKKQIELLKP